MQRVRIDTDRHVLTALLASGRLTRADIAVAAGVSKPTASESVRRLVEAGTLVEAGLKEGGRGRVGVYYELAPHAGLALALDAGPEGIVAECVDAAGELRHREDRMVGRSTDPAGLRAALSDVILATERAVGHDLPLRALSVAEPVDRSAARLVHLSGSPFVTGEVDLADLVGPHGVVDNDVHWAALAEMREKDAGGDTEERDASSFVYVFLGTGLGAAVVDGGRLVTGARGLAGEIAHVLTSGPDGRAMRALDALDALGLLTPGGTAIDVPALRRGWQSEESRTSLVSVVAGVLASTIALTEPADIVLGGPWADLDGLASCLEQTLAELAPHRVPVRLGRVPSASRVGVRLAATDLARADLLAEQLPATSPTTLRA